MWELWGEVAPVPEERLHVLQRRRDRGGLSRRLHARATPRTTSAYLHEDSGDAYVGDVAGVRIPPYDAHPRAHAAARHRCGGVAPLAAHRRVAGTRSALPDPFRPRARRRPSSCTACAQALAESADSARLDGEERFIAKLETESRRGHRCGPVRGVRAGRPARPALPGPRALLAQEGRADVGVADGREAAPGAGPSSAGQPGDWAATGT